MATYRLVALSPSTDVAVESAIIDLKPGVPFVLGRTLLCRPKEELKKVSRKQAEIVVHGETVLFAAKGVNPCSVKGKEGKTEIKEGMDACVLQPGAIISLCSSPDYPDLGQFKLGIFSGVIVSAHDAEKLGDTGANATKSKKRKRDEDSTPTTSLSLDLDTPTDSKIESKEGQEKEKQKEKDKQKEKEKAKEKGKEKEEYKSPKPTKKKQKIEPKDKEDTTLDASAKVRAIKEIFPDVDEAQILRVLSSLGQDQEKAVQYFLDESAKSESVEEKLRRMEEEKKKLEAELVKFPGYWEDQDEDLALFKVDASSSEYQWVVERFSETAVNTQVTCIQRVQNKKLWRWYHLKKQEVSNLNDGSHNEKYLFHGSNVTNVPVILKGGLDMRVSNLGGAIGAGIYFAVDAVTSLGYVSGATVHNDCQMLLCRVALGSVTQGQSGLRRPPNRIDKSDQLYDSVDGMLGGRKMYAIFDNHQSYPEYLIHYHSGSTNNPLSYAPFSFGPVTTPYAPTPKGKPLFSHPRPTNSGWGGPPPGY